jgi:hypothetical protein
MILKRLFSIARCSCWTLGVWLMSIATPAPAVAAQGEMGTGIPVWSTYGYAVSGTRLLTVIWTLGPNPLTPMPAGCSTLTLTTDTLGADGYKVAIAMLLQASALGKSIQFYAHASRDWGCGVDYMTLNP